MPPIKSSQKAFNSKLATINSAQKLNLKLVKAVEKHPCLYDTTNPDYTRKSPNDEAWNEISEAVDRPVNRCREKWKNLRTVFVRNYKLEQLGYEKSSYYLNDHMRFLIPFLKNTLFPDRGSTSETGGDSGGRYYNPEDDNTTSITSSSENDATEQSSEDAADPLEEDSDELSTILTPVIQLEQVACNVHGQGDAGLKRKRSAANELGPGWSKTLNNGVVSNERPTVAASVSVSDPDPVDEPRKMFLLSLLPEVNDFTERQMRTFKRKVLALIDDIIDVSSHSKINA